ncbi:MAG: hypothetical protein IJK53_09875 [Erysipelotrichaceae bacterium]|nr:hypothetical protein [Clostridia bacterium]MBQ6217676.1 hypothetical protein [Erysipelotrichaceae bacterium]
MEERFLALIRLAIKYNVTEIYFSNSYYYSEIEMKVDGIYRKAKPKLVDGQMIGYLKRLAGLDAEDTERQTAVFAEDIDGMLRYFRFTSFLYHGYPRAILEMLP